MFAEKIEIILKFIKTDIVFLRIAVSAKGELKSALRCEFQIPYYILAKHTRYKTGASEGFVPNFNSNPDKGCHVGNQGRHLKF